MSFFSRTPFALLAGFGLFSLVSDVLRVQEDIRLWLAAWEAVTYPIWNFLLGWIFEFLEINFRDWIKDYLTLGLITFGCSIRYILHNASDGAIRVFVFNQLGLRKFFLVIIFMFLFKCLIGWPVIIAIMSHNAIVSKDESENVMIFFESFVYTIILIALNYALIY